MKLVRWKRFQWELAKLPPAEAALPTHFGVRPAVKEDQRAVRDVIFSAFSLDSAWSDIFKRFRPVLEAQMETAFERTPLPLVVMTHGQRVIAASLLSLEVAAENHLLSGPCVLVEYRSRGLGTALLHQSLKTMHGNGLTRAFGICKETAPAAKFVYRKFGSVAETYDYNFALVS